MSSHSFISSRNRNDSHLDYPQTYCNSNQQKGKQSCSTEEEEAWKKSNSTLKFSIKKTYIILSFIVLWAPSASTIFEGKIQSFTADQIHIDPNGRIVQEGKRYMTPEKSASFLSCRSLGYMSYVPYLVWLLRFVNTVTL